MTEVETLKESLKAICKEGEAIKERYAKRMADNKTKFDAIFAQIWKIEPRGENDMNPFASTDEITAKAIEAAGFSSDNEIITAFKEHQSDYYSFCKLNEESKEINFQIAALLLQQKQPSIKTDGWQFKEIKIVAPKQILEDIIYPIIEAEAKEGKGLFANITDTPLEDIDEDEFDMVEVYNCQATLTKYIAELKRFGIIGAVGDEAFLNKTFKKALMILLKGLATYIKENTDKQAATKNKITDTIKILDELPHWGLFLQILTLQGLCRWLESVNINDGDKGFDEVQCLHDWICEILIKKEIAFCYIPFGDEDKERLKPFCNYLYSTEIGRLVQNLFNPEPQPEKAAQECPRTLKDILPEKLQKDDAVNIFKKAIDAQMVDFDGKSLVWRDTKQLLAYFAQQMSEKFILTTKLDKDGNKTTDWKTFENLFNQEDLKQAKQNWMRLNTKFEPTGFEKVDAIM